MGIHEELAAQRPMRRIAVIGGVGTGKTTLAATIARHIGVPHIELDALRYDSHWQPLAAQVFHAQVAQYAGMDRWVIDGNYEAVRDIVWVRADIVVWLDYSLRVVLLRFVGRTVRRLLRREAFSADKRERISRLLGKDSLLLWALRSHSPRREKFEELLASNRYAHAQIVRLKTPSATVEWLANFTAGNSLLQRQPRGLTGIEQRPSQR